MHESVPARMHFAKRSVFYDDLKRRVSAYFENTKQSMHGDWRLYLKTVIMLTWLSGSYALLLLAPLHAWQAVLLAVSLGMAMAGVGFNVMHDANHGGYSHNKFVNRALGATLDFIGGSSYMWKQKHNVLHHTFTNVEGLDNDIAGNGILRFGPGNPIKPWHRYQHLYVWLLYAVYPIGWWFIDDFQRAITGRIATNKIPKPRRAELWGLIAGKAVFYGWAFIIPVLVRPTWVIVPLSFVTIAALGLTLAIVFQLAHCLGEAEFHDLTQINQTKGNTNSRDWAVHQVTTTVDFARGNKLLSWYLGGLNFQVEHHLFSKVSHVHYPALSRIVEETCRAHGVRYRAHTTFFAALRSNVRWLRQLGQQPTVAASPIKEEFVPGVQRNSRRRAAAGAQPTA